VIQVNPADMMLAVTWSSGHAEGSRLVALLAVLAILLFSGLICLVVESRAQRRDRKSGTSSASEPPERANGDRRNED